MKLLVDLCGDASGWFEPLSGQGGREVVYLYGAVIVIRGSFREVGRWFIFMGGGFELL